MLQIIIVIYFWEELIK